MTFYSLLIFISSFSFLFYGILCLIHAPMKVEFQRYGFEKLRVLTGTLEVLGGTALLVGFESPLALRVGAGGLGLLMFLALGVRFKIKDSLIQSLPAFVLMIINFYILAESFRAG